MTLLSIISIVDNISGLLCVHRLVDICLQSNMFINSDIENNTQRSSTNENI